MARKLFALDQGFPLPIIDALRGAIREAELVWVGNIHKRLSDASDWQLLHALHHHPREWEGLITTDQGMLRLPQVLSVLCQTKLTLVVAESAGHDPLRATGLLLTHLPGICRRTDPTTAQLWRLRATAKKPEDPWVHLRRLAERAGMKANEYYKAHRLSRPQLASDPFEDWD